MFKFSWIAKILCNQAGSALKKVRYCILFRAIIEMPLEGSAQALFLYVYYLCKQ